MSHLAYLSAQAAYDAEEPRESASAIRITERTTVRELADALDTAGVHRLTLAIHRGKLSVCAETNDADGAAIVAWERYDALSRALSEAIDGAAEAQRAHDGEDGR